MSVALPGIDRTREKWCPRCRTVKSLDDFSRNRTARDGHRPYCKPCDRDMKREARRHQREALVVTPTLMQLTDRMRDKRCRNCGEVKPLSAYHRDRYCPDGRKSACKTCVNAQRREKAAKKRAASLPPRPAGVDVATEKWCPQCQVVKPFASFHKDRRTADGYYLYCRSCHGLNVRNGYARKQATQRTSHGAATPQVRRATS